MCRAQSLERSGSLGICPRNIIPENEDLCQSEEFPVIGSLIPFEVVPIYQAGRACESREFESEDISASGCSSAAYSFAPINPAIRDVLTDLEAHEITRQEKTNIESRRAWSKKCALVSTPRRQLYSSECTIVAADANEPDPTDTRDTLNFIADGVEESDEKESSQHIFRTASSALDAQLSQKSSGKSGESRGGSDVSLCDGFPALQPAAKDAVVQCAGPQLTFWDVDSRGSAGLNFVFVDDFPSKLPRRWPDEFVASCTSSTVDSVVFGSLGGKRFIAASSMTSQECNSSNDDVSRPEFEQKYCTELEVIGSEPFYDMESAAAGGAPPQDGERGCSEPYDVSFDVSFDFVTNTVSGEQADQVVHVTQTTAKDSSPACLVPSSTNVLRGFLRSQGHCMEDVPVAREMAGGSGMFTPSFIEVPSFDNVSRSFSDSDVSEGRGRTLPGVAVYRNKLYEQPPGAVKLDMPVRVDPDLLLQQSDNSNRQKSNGCVGGELVSESSLISRFHALQPPQTSPDRSEGTLSPLTPGSQASPHGNDSAVNKPSKPPRKAPSLERCYSARQASTPEIEATEDDDNYLKARIPGQVQSSSHLYDSSRSWMCQVTGSTVQGALNHLTHRSHAGDTLISGKQSRKHQKPRVGGAVYKGLSKLLMCFSG